MIIALAAFINYGHSVCGSHLPIKATLWVPTHIFTLYCSHPRDLKVSDSGAKINSTHVIASNNALAYCFFFL